MVRLLLVVGRRGLRCGVVWYGVRVLCSGVGELSTKRRSYAQSEVKGLKKHLTFDRIKVRGEAPKI